MSATGRTLVLEKRDRWAYWSSRVLRAIYRLSDGRLTDRVRLRTAAMAIGMTPKIIMNVQAKSKTDHHEASFMRTSTFRHVCSGKYSLERVAVYPAIPGPRGR